MTICDLLPSMLYICELLAPLYLLEISSVGSFPYKNPMPVCPRRYFGGQRCSADQSREHRCLGSNESEGRDMLQVGRQDYIY